MAIGVSGARDEVARRFRDACAVDPRIQAAFIGGSVGAGAGDAWADIDLYVVLADDDYPGFFDDRNAFLEGLGTPVFREHLDNFGFDVIVFILESGVDGELVLHRMSEPGNLPGGMIAPVVDRAGILANRPAVAFQPGASEMAGDLHVVLVWFWRDTLHCIRAIARGRLWTAWVFLDKMRGGVAWLLTLEQVGNRQPSGAFVPFEGYEALDHLAPTRELAALRASVAPVEREPMLEAARTLIGIYRRHAPDLAARHGEPYPSGAEAVVIARFGDVVPAP
jgi:hypothetical protein